MPLNSEIRDSKNQVILYSQSLFIFYKGKNGWFSEKEFTNSNPEIDTFAFL
jgi:hypothetical protein